MPNLKDIKTRIGSVKKTKQITAAMKLVSGAKLKRATEAATSARPYQQKLTQVLQRIAAVGAIGDEPANPLLAERSQVSRVLVVVLTTDRGLCGGFNFALLRQVERMLQTELSGTPFDLIVYGRKGRDFLTNRKIPLTDSLVGYAKTPAMDLVRSLTQRMVQAFTERTHDRVLLVSNAFVNTITQTPRIQQVLPVALPEGQAAQAGDFAFEPNATVLLDSLVPLYLRTLVLQAFLETFAGEQAARMTAMESATRNATDLISSLTLDYNRARQAAITTELVEIVAGAEAL